LLLNDWRPSVRNLLPNWRALAAWAGAAGYGLVAWGLGTEAPTAAEARQNIQQLQKDLLRKRVTEAPATAGASVTPAARHLLRRASQYGLAATVVGMVLSVRWGLRHPRRLTALAIASQAPDVVFSVLRVARPPRQENTGKPRGTCLRTPGLKRGTTGTTAAGALVPAS
jgi:hypothetical protein